VDATLFLAIVIAASLCVECGAFWGITSMQLHPHLQTRQLPSLPRLSGHFLKWLEGNKPAKWSPMPCPRCGHRPVPARAGAIVLGVAGIRALFFYLVVLAILGYVASQLAGTLISLGICAAGLLGIALLPLLKVPLGKVYHCPSCGLSWTYAETDKVRRRIAAQS
jgi:DNA-directed RNA polymerase subunit RPC12/RpoP